MSDRALAEAGRVLGARYRLVRSIGRGGMGEVWVAEHVTLGAAFAVKVISAQGARGTALAARFLREAAISAKTRHPCIVRATDYGEEQGLLWYAMELLEGESLESKITREAPLDPAAAVALLQPLVHALTYLHERGLVHRDLKPANVFLARVEGRAEPELRLLDFGIARDLDDGARLTTDEAILGSPAYMAPEQASGAREHGPAADQYALAVIVYEMLTGELPHGAPTLLAMLHARATEPPVPILSRRPELPAALADAVTKALATKPEHRHASVEDFAAALRNAVRGAPPPEVDEVTEADVAPRVEAPVVERTSSGGAAPERASPAATNPARGCGGVAVAVVGALVSVVVLATMVWMMRAPAAVSSRPDVAAPRVATVAPAGLDAQVLDARLEPAPREPVDAGVAVVTREVGVRAGRGERRARAVRTEADEGSPLLRAMQGIYRALPDGGR